MITFPKPALFVITPATTRTVPVPSVTFSAAKIDWADIEEYTDRPNQQTLHVRLKGWPIVQIMGAGVATPYNPRWLDADAQAAFLARLNVTVDADSVGTVAAPPKV